MLIRGDAAFGKPGVYEHWEQETTGYAFRLLANGVLRQDVCLVVSVDGQRVQRHGAQVVEPLPDSPDLAGVAS